MGWSSLVPVVYPGGVSFLRNDFPDLLVLFPSTQSTRRLRSYPEAIASPPMQQAEVLKELGNKAFQCCQYAEAQELYSEAIALFPIPESQQDSALLLLTVLNSNAAECALKRGHWHTAIELSEAALLISAGHKKSTARKRRAELSLTLHNSLPEEYGTEAEVRRAVQTLSQLLLPDLFGPQARKSSLYNGDARADDKNVDLMFAMTPSLYDAMHDTIVACIV